METTTALKTVLFTKDSGPVGTSKGRELSHSATSLSTREISRKVSEKDREK